MPVLVSRGGRRMRMDARWCWRARGRDGHGSFLIKSKILRCQGRLMEIHTERRSSALRGAPDLCKMAVGGRTQGTADRETPPDTAVTGLGPAAPSRLSSLCFEPVNQRENPAFNCISVFIPVVSPYTLLGTIALSPPQPSCGWPPLSKGSKIRHLVWSSGVVTLKHGPRDIISRAGLA